MLSLEVTLRVVVRAGNEDGNITSALTLLNAYAVGGFAHHGANRYVSQLTLVDDALKATADSHAEFEEGRRCTRYVRVLHCWTRQPR